jgi:hypothetical protein
MNLTALRAAHADWSSDGSGIAIFIEESLTFPAKQNCSNCAVFQLFDFWSQNLDSIFSIQNICGTQQD